MKRYLVFTYDTYYPAGGMNDLKETTDDLEEAKSLVDNAQVGCVYDTVLNEVVYDTDAYQAYNNIILKGE